MTKLGFVVVLASCDAGAPRTPPEPVKKVVEVPAPRDAGVVIADAAGPTPALAGARLQVNHFDLPPQAECARTRLVLKLIDKSKNVVDEYKENSTCTGACTAKEKRDAEAQVAEIQARIDRENTTESELDYNFTGCLATGLEDVTIFRKVAGRDVALISDRYTGPHDWLDARYYVALEVCGKIWVSDTFAELQAHTWPMDRLQIKSDGDDKVVVLGLSETGETIGTLLALQMPACPGAPAQQSNDLWPIPELGPN